MAGDFRSPESLNRDSRDQCFYWPHDMQIPVSMTATFMHDFPWQSANATFLYTFARLKSKGDRAAAESRLKVIGPRIGLKISDPKNPDQTARWNRFSLAGASQGPGFMEDRSTQTSLVSGIAVLTLLIACANIACLLLARASAQERETAVQIALGAPRGRIMQRYIIESLLLTTVGGCFGLIASHWLTHLFIYVLNLGYLHVGLDAGMLLFAIVACAATALLFGLFPGWQASRTKVETVSLREHGSARTSRNLFRKMLVAFQIALATVLLIGLGLCVRSLEKVQAVDLGVDPKHVVVVDIDPGKAGRSDVKALAIYRAVLERVRLLPDVESASLALGTPFSGFVGTASFDAAKMTSAKVQNRLVTAMSVGSDFFRTLGIRILRGRDFNSDDFKKRRTVIVNRAFVEYYRLGEHAVGHRFEFDGDTEIVGVVADSKYQSVREASAPAMFFPVADGWKGQLSIVARAHGTSDSLLREIRGVVRAVDSQTPVTEEKRLDNLVLNQYFDQRAITALCSLFSIFALGLSCIGVYGVAAYSISRRTQEIGVRFALGAGRWDVANLFMRESLALICTGLLVGIPAALGLASLVKAVLFGVAPTDPYTILVAAATLAIVCIGTSMLSLRKAFAVNPVEALRSE